MSQSYPMVALREIVCPVGRAERPLPGTTYRQLGVRLWGEGAYERESIDGSQTKYGALYRVEADDLVVNKIWARNGSVAVVAQELAGSYVSGEFPTFVPVANRLHPRWMHWLTKARSFWQQCDEKSRGTSGKNRIRPEQFLAVEVPLPPLIEQRRIVARIEAVADRFETARGLRREVAEDLTSLVVSLHLEVAGQRKIKLGDILDLYEQRVGVEPGIDYPQVGVRSFGLGLFARETVTADTTTYRFFHLLYDGALVLSQVKGWEGAIAVCDPHLARRFVSPEYRTFRPKPDGACAEYLAALVRTPWFLDKLTVLTRGVGGRRERTRPEHLLELVMPFPTVQQQNALAPILARLDPIRRLQAETAAELDALLPAVLERAFAGDL